MAAVIAKVTGTALTPGISRNGRLYTREAIARAVTRAQARIADGKRPISMRSHHAAGGDSTHIVGHATRIWQDPDTGAARYESGIADTVHGRDIAALTDDTDGQPQHLRGVSIRGAWMEEPRTETVDGRSVQTADDLEISGIDFTGEPGVDDADVHHLAPGSDEDAPDARFAITESVDDTMLAAHVQEKGAEPLKSGKPAAAQTKATVYADPGYQGDRAKRYALDTKKQAKAAWAFINQADNAKDYTAAQLKRIKQRIAKALKGFGVEVNTAEHYLVDPVAALTESVTLAECVGCYGEQDPREAGSFYVTLTNGPVSVSVSSYRVDPADLDLIGRAAMDGACKALATLDPDMDGDIDVPGADAEDTDRDLPTANVPGTACPCGCGCAIPLEPGDCPCVCVCDVCGDGEPMAEQATAVETTPDPAADAAEPAPEPAADPTTETEEPAVSEPTTAVEPTQAAPAPAPGTFTFEQVQQLLAAAAAPRPVEAAPAPVAPVVEAAPAAPAPVAETQEQMIARLVSDGITAGVQKLVSTGALNPSRKGLAGRPVTETGEDPVVTEFGVPEDWPQKPLHTYTAEEHRHYTDRALAEHVLGNALYTGRRSG